tara:strand:- start:454 stop:669 length:216 start_codon:yes stop_codon:yes gene_type:complete
MSHDKKKPKQIASEFVATASGKLEEAVAEELEIEDPAPEEAEAIIEELTVEEEEEETLPNGNPVRHRGPIA